jgi:4-aminobutyrate aminotransferase-like enzyme
MKNYLQEFAADRGGKLFYDYIGSGIGNGPLVELADGSVKYDFITGIGVHYFGHSHPGVS